MTSCPPAAQIMKGCRKPTFMAPTVKSWKQELQAGHRDSKKRVGFVLFIVGTFLDYQMHCSKLMNFASDVLPFGILGKGLMLWEGWDEALIGPSTLHFKIVQNFNRASQISDGFFALILRKEASCLKFTFFTWFFPGDCKAVTSQWQPHCHHHVRLCCHITQILLKLFGNKWNWRHINFKWLTY